MLELGKKTVYNMGDDFRVTHYAVEGSVDLNPKNDFADFEWGNGEAKVTHIQINTHANKEWPGTWTDIDVGHDRENDECDFSNAFCSAISELLGFEVQTGDEQFDEGFLRMEPVEQLASNADYEQLTALASKRRELDEQRKQILERKQAF